MRATLHNSRRGDSGGILTSKHNDRNFNIENAEHINEAKTNENVQWKFQELQDVDVQEMTIDDYEGAVYEKFFSESLNSRNEKALAQRHPDRVQTMEQFRKNAKACPEETIFQIGNRDNKISPETLKKIFEDFVSWHKEAFPNIMLLDASLHLDEDEAAPHIHYRKIYTAQDKDGKFIISQKQCLQDLNIERPDTSKSEGKHNNAKMTYTQICRQKEIELAKTYGIEIEEVPREPSRSGKTLLQFKAEGLKKEIDDLKMQTEELVRSLEPLPTKTTKTVFGTKEVPKSAEEIQRDKEILAAQAVMKDFEARQEDLKRAEEKISEKREQLNREIKKFNNGITELQQQNSFLKAELEKAKEKINLVQTDFQKQIKFRDKTIEKQDRLLKIISGKVKPRSVSEIVNARTLQEQIFKQFGVSAIRTPSHQELFAIQQNNNFLKGVKSYDHNGKTFCPEL